MEKNKEKFLEKSKKIHNNKYDYSLVEYKGDKIKVKIICPLHGEFEQVAHNHLKGAGCPHCNESKGEIKIKKFLNDLKIQYETQKKFLECKHKGLLPFDFFISSFNTCIEYDGIQHFKPIKIFGGEKAFEELKIRDKIKTEFCLKNNIKLLRIKYNENVENKIKSFLH